MFGYIVPDKGEMKIKDMNYSGLIIVGYASQWERVWALCADLGSIMTQFLGLFYLLSIMKL